MKDVNVLEELCDGHWCESWSNISYCVLDYWLCDQWSDCKDGSDESDDICGKHFI